MLTLSLAYAEETRSQTAKVFVDGVESHTFEVSQVILKTEYARRFLSNPTTYGEKLHEALFRADSLAESALNNLPDGEIIVLISNHPALDSIPWEFACRDGSFIAQRYSMFRTLPENERPANINSFHGQRLPLVYIPSNPLVDQLGEPLQPLDVLTEWRNLEKTILGEAKSAVDLNLLRPSTRDALQRFILRNRSGIIHFSGHGLVNSAGKSSLIFEKDDGRADIFDARDFIDFAKEYAVLVFLSACLSATPGPTEYTNIARGLVKSGIPYVVGMQYPVKVDAAERITDYFYLSLFNGRSVPDALRQARRATANTDLFQSGIPVLYVANPEKLDELRIPEGEPQKIVSKPSKDRLQIGNLPAPRSGFFGRQKELVNIGELIGKRNRPLTVTLHGLGGVGKTALLAQSAEHFSWRYPDGVLGLRFEPLPQMDELLGLLEQFLNLPEVLSLNSISRIERIRAEIHGKNVLIALDNLETLVHARDAVDDPDLQLRSQNIHNLLSLLASSGITLINSSRIPSGLPGEVLVPIRGLDSVYGAMLFMQLCSTRKSDLNFAQAEEVSTIVNGHPLAIRLLAAYFQRESSVTLGDLITQIEQALPSASVVWDGDEGQRHKGLDACFDFSIRHLPGELAQDLYLLSIFTSGFIDQLAAYVLRGSTFVHIKDVEEYEKFQGGAISYAKSSLSQLWERGLLERDEFPVDDQTLYIYSLHPAIRPLAHSRLADHKREENTRNFCEGMHWIAILVQQSNWRSPFLSFLAKTVRSDLIHAAQLHTGTPGAHLKYAAAFILRQFGEFGIALKLLEESRDINVRAKNSLGAASAISAIAEIQILLGNSSKSLEYLNQALQIKDEIEDISGQAFVFFNMGKANVAQGNFDDAMSFFQKSLHINTELNNLDGVASSLAEIARIYRTWGELEKAIEYFQKAIQIFLQEKNWDNYSSIALDISDVLFYLGNIDEAIRILNVALDIKESIGDFPGKAAVLNSMASIYRSIGKIKEALNLYEEALQINLSLNHLEGVACVQGNLGETYFAIRNYDKALELFSSAVSIDEEIGNLHGKAVTLGQIAVVYSANGEYKDAIQLNTQALELFDKLGDLRGKANTMNDLAITYAQMDNLKMSETIFRQALKLHEELGNIRGKMHALANLGAAIKEHHLPEALAYLDQALEISYFLNDPLSTASILGLMIDPLLRNHEYKKAVHGLVMAHSIFFEHNIHSEVSAAESMLNDIRNALTPKNFDPIWDEVTQNQPIPDWLARPPGTQMIDPSITDFIVRVIAAYKSKSPDAQEYFNTTSKMASNLDAPAELQELGKVLQRILCGDRHPNLSSLPLSWANAVEAELNRY